MPDLEVTGGLGGIEVAIEDLRRAAVLLRRTAEVVDDTAAGVWRVSPWLLLTASAELAHLCVRARLETADVSRDVDEVVRRLVDLSATTDRAADGYALGERGIRLLVAGLNDQAMAMARIVTEATGQAFGLLDEGEGFDVVVTPVAAQPGVAAPSSTTSLLVGIETLGGGDSPGRVRVIELPVADGSTTWVVQVPGTHGGWYAGGEVPMDWPANVSLMLDATSASKVGTLMALERAQAGRAGERDRVVLAGHSQGGIVAAALASDPGFTSRHRVSHVVTAGSPIDDFPIPDRTQVLSLQHRTDPVHALDLSPPPDRRSWTTVAARPDLADVRDHLRAGAHGLGTYRVTASRVDRSEDVSLRHWRSSLAPALTAAPGSAPVVHEFHTARRWQNRDS